MPPPVDDRYVAPAAAYVRPSRPAIVDGPPSEAAAVAFAEYYLRLYTYAYLTGDARDLNALGRDGCIFCANVAADIAREYGGGGHDEGGVITVESASSHDYGVDGFFSAQLSGRQAPNRELDSSGKIVVANSVERTDLYEFGLYWHDSTHWRVAEVAVTPQ